MKVQRVCLPRTEQMRWIVLDDAFVPVQPILSYLTFLDDLGRSPNTIRATAHHLKLFWEYLRDEHINWMEIDIAHLAGFITWLRRPDPMMISIATQKARRTNATIDQALSAVHGFYQFHERLHTVSPPPLYQLSMPYHRRYKPFLHGIAKTKPEQTRVVSVKREQRQPNILTSTQIQHLLDACTHTRDRFLLALLFSTGMRIGQALGLKHEDISVEDGTIQIVPRQENPNGARTKTRMPHTLPVEEEILELYTDYLVGELGALEVEALPDFVFVNLFEGELGRPMTYAAVMSLTKRLVKKTGVPFTPHLLRHSRATIWIKQDHIALPVVSRLLTHASIQTTNDLYLHLSAEDLRAALKSEEERS